MKKPIVLFLNTIFLLFAFFSVHAQTPAYKGIFIDTFDDIVGNPVQEDSLLYFLKDSSYNSIICYQISTVLSSVASSTKNTNMANFIRRARTQFGIKNVLASSETVETFSTLVDPYNRSRTDSLERFNYFYLEFEFWNVRSTSTKSSSNNGYYCTNYLSPKGYSCDTSGAFKYYKKMLKSIDSLAHKSSIRSATYVGKPNLGQAKYISNTVDLIFCDNYTANVSSIYNNVITRFSYFGSTSKTVQIVPIFASYSPDGIFFGDWLTKPPVGKHSEKGAYNAYFLPRFTAETASWKSKVNVVGYQWYRYSGMPHNGNYSAGNFCNPPANISASSISQNSATLSWTAVSNSVGYMAQYKVYGSSNWSTPVSLTANSLNVTALSPSTSYEFQVKSNCGFANSSYSTPLVFTTSSVIACPTVSSLQSSAINSSGASFSWTASSGATSYSLRYRQTGTSSWNTASSSTTNYSVNNLLASTAYEFQVQANCTSGNSGSFSASHTFTTLSAACGVPSLVTAMAASTSTITVTWVASPVATGYSIQYKKASSSSWTTVTSSTAIKNISSLSTATTYQVKVAMLCPSGTSAYSSAVSVTTFSSTSTCIVPTGLFVSDVATTSVTLNWIPTSGAVSYTIQYRKVGTSSWQVKTTSFANKSITGLSLNTNYEFNVRTECSSGRSAYSSSFVFKTALIAARLDASTLHPNASLFDPLEDQEDLTIEKSVFMIFPNPTNQENINLKIQVNQESELYLTLYDLLGKVIYTDRTKTDSNGFLELNFKTGFDLVPGIYLLQGQTSTEKFSSKFIIQ